MLKTFAVVASLALVYCVSFIIYRQTHIDTYEFSGQTHYYTYFVRSLDPTGRQRAVARTIRTIFYPLGQIDAALTGREYGSPDTGL